MLGVDYDNLVIENMAKGNTPCWMGKDVRTTQIPNKMDNYCTRR